MSMTADGDSQDEALAGSLGLALRDADDKLDGHLSGGRLERHGATPWRPA